MLLKLFNVVVEVRLKVIKGDLRREFIRVMRKVLDVMM